MRDNESRGLCGLVGPLRTTEFFFPTCLYRSYNKARHSPHLRFPHRMHAHADAQLAPASSSESARSTNAFQREAEAAEHRIAKRLQMLTGWLRMRFGPNPLPSIPEPNPDDMAIMRSLLLPMAAFGMKSFAKCSYDVIFRMWVSAPACEWLCHPAGAAAPLSDARMCRKWVETGRKPIRSWNVMLPPPAPLASRTLHK